MLDDPNARAQRFQKELVRADALGHDLDRENRPLRDPAHLERHRLARLAGERGDRVERLAVGGDASRRRPEGRRAWPARRGRRRRGTPVPPACAARRRCRCKRSCRRETVAADAVPSRRERRCRAARSRRDRLACSAPCGTRQARRAWRRGPPRPRRRLDRPAGLRCARHAPAPRPARRHPGRKSAGSRAVRPPRRAPAQGEEPRPEPRRQGPATSGRRDDHGKEDTAAQVSASSHHRTGSRIVVSSGFPDRYAPP